MKRSLISLTRRVFVAILVLASGAAASWAVLGEDSTPPNGHVASLPTSVASATPDRARLNTGTRDVAPAAAKAADRREVASAVRPSEVGGQPQPVPALASRAREAGPERAALTGPHVVARAQELEREVQVAIAAKDGRRALDVLRELAALGPDAWPTASQLFLQLGRSIDDDNWLGLDVYEFHRVARSGSLPELFLTALEDPNADAALRRFAVRELPWSDRAEVPERFLARLAVEQDPSIARRIAGALVDRPDAANVPHLLAALRAQTDADTRATIIEALGAIPGEAATRALAAIAANEKDADVRRAAELLAQGRAASVPGYLVTDVASGSQAATVGIRPGDIVTVYNGVPIDSSEALDRARAPVKAEEQVALTVVRAGAPMAFTIRGPRIGVNGRFVRPPAQGVP